MSGVEITCEVSVAMARRIVQASFPPGEAERLAGEIAARDLMHEVGASLLIVNAFQATLNGPPDDVRRLLRVAKAAASAVGPDTWIAHSVFEDME